MCCDFFNLKKQIDTFKENDIDYLHIDIMDGEFVPNYALGVDFIKQLKSYTDIPLDIHLMVKDVDKKIDYLPFGKNDIVSVHYETSTHLQRTISQIKAKGGKAFVALNPSTPLCVLEEILDDIDGVLVMTVNPGFAGQKLVPNGLKKITKVRKFLDENGKADACIEVDGNVSFKNAELMNQAGADIFVAGTSSVFGMELSTGVRTLYQVIK
jgi:ribulose-phosphate 3-epimerase